MNYTQFGHTGVRIPPLCIGTSDYGGCIDEAKATRIVHAALDCGIDMIDTADQYGAGISETIVGKAGPGFVPVPFFWIALSSITPWA